MRRPLSIAGLLILVAADARAQRPLTVTVAGGASFPVGAYDDAAGTGWHALAGLRLSTLTQPIGLRLDAAHQQFSGETSVGDQAITSGTLNATYRLPMVNSPISPYIIAGAGAYHLSCTGSTDCGSETRFGWNAG